ncbi:hypothetical protein ACFO25_09010 [Paenactinomyces guangxiensis]|uniref:Uncharacterized protein n=1 Tax=Paenactinomyces guangxiensis TaxID=1490290 RepID=A0A7W2A760_9BACL|nr:hypothetical protein [Paenactinomyces guangxiensis]MBA4492814.1 hypothetical protein [Paenactinomyces guangxiensis]MBH8590337.1 hypothetical protein [Paenactinomyces guangxiensis]
MHDLHAEDLSSEIRALRERLACLEKKIELAEQRLDQLVKENQKLNQDMRFFELMLLEEYHLLLQLLGKDQSNLRIHSLEPSSGKLPNAD